MAIPLETPPPRPTKAPRYILMTLLTGLAGALSFTFLDPYMHPEKYNERVRKSKAAPSENKKKGMWKEMDKDLKAGSKYEQELEAKMLEYERRQQEKQQSSSASKK